MARFLFIWMVMIGAMIGVREGSHFEVDVWPDLGPRATAALQLAAGAFILLFAFVFLWAGWEFTRFAWNRVSELADLPLWMIHIAWPVTGLRSEEHTSELQSRRDLVCRLLLEKKNKKT